MAKPRSPKLKVFRTPIGFHDAIVAAPSQKAALEAWGADSNLFAQGAAEQVEEPALVAAALERPGEVVRVPRGSKDEQIAALGREVKRSKTGGASASARAKGKGAKAVKPARPPKPSRATVVALEDQLAEATKRHAKAVGLIDDEIAALQRKRRDAAREHRREQDAIEERLASEQARYDRKFEAWKNE
ncbi:hypothetical protein G7078_09135 [Sphingomonas sinipercae]|uniref:Cell envelope biogenesis protein TolA n=1 Tax=Sphingomonas sinipercae TaxID=2714944 RepID=A0A6G7ZPK7_9SPHN|nr:hypothetical protein [Sphingomonas sinipercae]QIL02927.1 hypothetical protein G7078_09135 [Sphingomonas sinipercae]